MRTILKPVVALAAVAAAWFSATDVLAFGHHRGHSSGGSWGSSGGSYGSWGSSGGSSGGSWGSSGGYHVVHRHRWHSSGGSWGSSGGSWGSSGGSSGGYYYNGSSGGSSGGSNGGVIYSDEGDAVPTTPPAAPANPPAPADVNEGKSAFNGTGLLLVNVPADAKVFVNGKATASTGTERQYLSRGLVRGAAYNYEVKVEMIRDGQPITITKTAKLTAGGNAQLAFDETADVQENIASTEPLTTKLVVNVPADAKVFLAGNQTKQVGEVREFTTNKLAAGDGWNDYTVRAEIEQDGQTLVKEQLVSIQAGESKEISFDFADSAIEEPIAETAQN